jgi:hypothetical protein
MDLDIPVRPARISREQAREQKARSALFAQQLKFQAKGSGWKLAYGSLFRAEKDWFVDVLPWLLWQRGVRLMLHIKPMAIDPIFWRIVGMQENERLPLSFRASGAWVLRPPYREASIALDQTDPGALAAAAIAWATDQLASAKAASLTALLTEIEALGDRRKFFVAFEICLRLLMDDWDGAFALCRNRGPLEDGGFWSDAGTFLDQARNWIAARRPS